MDRRPDHVVADVNAQLANDTYPKSVSKDGQRDHRQHQDSSCPGPIQKQVARHQAGHEQHQRGMNSTAFGSDRQREIRQVQIQPIPHRRRAAKPEEAITFHPNVAMQAPQKKQSNASVINDK